MTKKAKKPAKNSLSANAATCRDNSYNKKVSKASEKLNVKVLNIPEVR